MSKTWVERAIESLATDEQRNKADLICAQRAEGMAPIFFDRLARCVQDDVSKLVAAKPRLVLEFQRFPSDKFIVSRSEFPCATLDVERIGVRLRVCHSFRLDSAGDRSLKESDCLLIADLQGNIMWRYQSQTFTDKSCLSEMLLWPVLNFLRRSR